VFRQLVAKGLSDGLGPLPTGAEAWFVIPDWRKVADTYNGAVSEALDRLSRSRATSLSRADRLGPERLRQTERTREVSAALKAPPGGDFIAIGAQFGNRHKGRSIRHARELFASNEFGLGAFAVACMLVTHPERLSQSDQLYVDCAGDEYTASDEPQFTEAPYFRFLDGKVAFGTSWIGYPDPFFGSASAFI
jgi:hypothetical protein